MGDATPEDVIAEFIAGEVGYGPTDGMVEQARELRAALAAAGYAVVPQRDVDAAARLRDAVVAHQRAKVYGLGPDGIDHDAQLWAAVGSVDPEGERCPTCGSDDPRVSRLRGHDRPGHLCLNGAWHTPDRGDR